jgi:tRNA(adenine34) deaminase
MKHDEWMRIALQQAEIAFMEDEVPIGAVIVRNGEVLAAAHNEKEKGQDPTAHAEIVAIRQAAEKLGHWRLSDAVLYVTLEPCPMCAGACVLSRVDRVVYGASDPKMGCAGSKMDLLREDRFNQWVEVIPGVMKEECAALLTDFFDRLRAKRK